ncbi:MAG: GIY-YIG nuclease family protein [Candidatus Methylomirabilia bacterium]
MKSYFVYILTNARHTVLYTGVTGDLRRRVCEHREKLTEGFTARYRVDKLVWYEVCEEPQGAIAREKQIKAGSRANKLALVDGCNPEWRDLWEDIA